MNSQTDFSERLRRIEAARPPRGQFRLHVGEAEMKMTQAQVDRRIAAIKAAQRPRAWPGILRTLVAPVLGVAGLVLALAVKLRLPVEITADPAIVDPLAGVLVALALALVSGVSHRLQLVLAVVAALGAQALSHNAAHLWPAPMAQLLSPDWVAQARATTAPRTAVLLGRSLSF
ncbi:hypothetical protein [Phaeovulum vinaykumarii]|uniref:Uncharacterized protein n=1 Tax=Phaeovulum vinaykumarii TaxID=407234 RepID=A0A1N7JIL5_9RHOB|nr:hypothetical protein [Phaeovulum vinaykumarii]SIS49183.1 hypothetical protein SAMN05421795_10118 [Phaeovulum vinaykumarii]SOB89451.1 hypothetical protein SAMN05878426_10118 [Phaeovulum vinaykumarii]